MFLRITCNKIKIEKTCVQIFFFYIYQTRFCVFNNHESSLVKKLLRIYLYMVFLFDSKFVIDIKASRRNNLQFYSVLIAT